MSKHVGYVALIGRPNVGKSTLLNQLLGQKLAITSHKPQTTRHRILGIKTTAEGQILYVDTPGIHQRGGKAMNRYLNRTAMTSLMDVDALLFVVQAMQWTDEDEAVLVAVKRSGKPAIAVVNKVDSLKNREQMLPYLAELGERHAFAAIVPVSARVGTNCEPLEHEVLKLLPEGELVYPEDQLSDRSGRFFAAELIREQLMRRYHNELPYALTVEIERFEEQEDMYRIGAVIWVERDSQKGIIVGKGGQSLKAAATAARQAMQEFFDCRVHLDLWVKVKGSWSTDEASLHDLGYNE